MRRKTKNIPQSRKTTNLVGSRALIMRSSRKISSKPLYEETRFRASILVLMGLLVGSTYLLAMAINWQRWPNASVSGINKYNYRLPKALAKNPAAASQILDDASLDFKLTLPNELGNWIYKTGFVIDPLDDSQSNQYLKIYLPLAEKKTASNFDSRYKDILTIIKFSTATWNKLDKGCQKGNSQYCSQEGTKILENDDFVFAYLKADDCPKEIQSKCLNIGKIISSFELR